MLLLFASLRLRVVVASAPTTTRSHPPTPPLPTPPERKQQQLATGPPHPSLFAFPWNGTNFGSSFAGGAGGFAAAGAPGCRRLTTHGENRQGIAELFVG